MNSHLQTFFTLLYTIKSIIIRFSKHHISEKCVPFSHAHWLGRMWLASTIHLREAEKTKSRVKNSWPFSGELAWKIDVFGFLWTAPNLLFTPASVKMGGYWPRSLKTHPLSLPLEWMVASWQVMNKLEQIIATCFSGLNYLLYAKWLGWQVHCQQNTLSCSMFAVHVCFIIKSSLPRIVFTCFLSYSCNQFSNSLLTQTWIRTDDLFIVVTAVSALQLWKVFSTMWPCYISMNR